MLYQKAKIDNGKLIIAESKVINQSELTADCWLIQFDGLKACNDCEFLDTEDCGGINIRKSLLENLNN